MCLVLPRSLFTPFLLRNRSGFAQILGVVRSVRSDAQSQGLAWGQRDAQRTANVMRTHVYMDTRGESRLLMALLAFALLAYALSAGAGMEMGWGDEPVEEPIASDASNDEADGLEDASSDDGGNQDPLEPNDSAKPEESSEEERRMLEGLSSLRARLDAARTQLVSERTAFDDACAAFARSTCAQEALMRSDKDAQERIAGLENARHRALVLLKLVQDELMQSDEYTTHALMTGSSTLHDVTLRHDMLERLMIAEGEQMRRLICDQKRLRAAIVLDAACARHARQELRVSIQSVNELAYKVEEGCARLRQCVKEVELSIGEEGNSRPAVVEAKDAVRSTICDALSLLADAEQGVGSWYDELDARADAQGALSFGEGIDFAFDENAFIETWGAAIDEYFADRARRPGRCPCKVMGARWRLRPISTRSIRVCVRQLALPNPVADNLASDPATPGGGVQPIATHTALLQSGHPSRRRSGRGMRAW